jgi:hypothetical protein
MGKPAARVSHFSAVSILYACEIRIYLFWFNDEGVYEVTPEFATIFDIASGYISGN